MCEGTMVDTIQRTLMLYYNAGAAGMTWPPDARCIAA